MNGKIDIYTLPRHGADAGYSKSAEYSVPRAAAHFLTDFVQAKPPFA